MMYWLLLILPGLVVLLLLAIHLGFRPPRNVETGTPADLGIDFTSVDIPTAGGKRLFAWLLPATRQAPFIVILHGWGGNAELMLPVARPFLKAGMNVLLLDSRNHGGSESDSFSSLPRFAEDAGSAVDWIKARFNKPSQKIALLGHSVGAGAVLLEASRREDISAVISISAFAHPEWMMRRYLERYHLPGLLLNGILRYVEWVIGHRFEQIAPLNTLGNISCPVLLVHGVADDIVPASDAEVLSHAADVELLLVNDAGHHSVDRIEEHGERLIHFLVKAGLLQD
jgi:pimeloyl-ACP methyl ester carboxylesterase